MFKLILVAIVAYLGYSFYIRYNIANKFNKSPDKDKSKSKYLKMNIRDADFEDIDDKKN